MMTNNPPYLQKDDTIGLLCPAGYMAADKIETCVRTLQEWGYRVKVGKTLSSEPVNYFSGIDLGRISFLR